MLEIVVDTMPSPASRFLKRSRGFCTFSEYLLNDPRALNVTPEW
jgi:hypothetical protein